jgi:putative ABC transport system permease protein
MSWRRHLAIFGALFRRRKPVDDLEEEICAHLEMEEQENLESGMPPEEAHYAALRRFGNVTLTQERSREMWGWNSVEALWQDVRFSLRMLRKNPGFTVVAILTLALGIGANTGIFSVVNAVLLRPLPYPDPDRLVQLWSSSSKWGGEHWQVAVGDFADIRDANRVFERLALFRQWPVNITGWGEPQRVPAARVSSEWFSVLDISPLQGRTFAPGEDQAGHEREVVVSYPLWQTMFGADPKLVGKTIAVDGKNYAVIGIMPSSFQFPGIGEGATRLWIPLVLEPGEAKSRSAHNTEVVGRLKPGVRIDRAQGEMRDMSQRLAREYPETDTGWGLRVVSLHDDLVGEVRPALLLLLAAVGLVLLIACSNVSNLLLARGAARRREMAVRASMGASRSRLIRQLLTESVLLALAGGLLGLLVAVWANQTLRAIGPRDIPRLGNTGIDAWVLGFSFAVSLLAGVVFGLLPALRTSQLDLNAALKEGGGSSAEGFALLRHRPARSLLLISEVALSLMLLVGATLVLRSFRRVVSVDLGMNPERVLSMYVMLPASRYGQSPQQAAFFRAAVERIKALPGVIAASAVNMRPLGGDMTEGFNIQEHPFADPENLPDASMRMVSADYFRVLEIRLLRGRLFTDGETSSSPRVAVINESMARRFWPQATPLGQHLEIQWGGSAGSYEIVGIVSNARDVAPTHEPKPEMYVPYWQLPQWAGALLVRTRIDPLKMAAAVKGQILSIDKDQPVSDIQTLEQAFSETVAEPRFRAELLSLFAFLAVALAGIGIYGVMAYSVAQRTHEIGIRIALGAERSDVLRLIVTEGTMVTMFGVLAGWLGAFSLVRFLRNMLYGVEPTDPFTFVLAPALLVSISLLASYIPARRATKVDPMVALRHE